MGKLHHLGLYQMGQRGHGAAPGHPMANLLRRSVLISGCCHIVTLSLSEELQCTRGKQRHGAAGGSLWHCWFRRLQKPSVLIGVTLGRSPLSPISHPEADENELTERSSISLIMAMNDTSAVDFPFLVTSCFPL